MLALAFDQHRAALAERGGVEGQLIAVERGLEALQPLVHHFGGDLVGHGGGGRAGAGRVLEAEALGVADRIDKAQRFRELGLGLAGEADDEIARQCNVGPNAAHPIKDAEVRIAAVAAVHRLEHPVAAGLHWQVQERHQLLDLAVRRDQAVGHVVGVAGGIADAGEFGDLGEFPDQAVEPDCAPLAVFA